MGDVEFLYTFNLKMILSKYMQPVVYIFIFYVILYYLLSLSICSLIQPCSCNNTKL